MTKMNSIKGEPTSNQNSAWFVHCLKMINTVVKDKAKKILCLKACDRLENLT